MAPRRVTTRLARRVAEARYEDRFETIARTRCERLGCGFGAACHG
jgi:hypothetical protein